MSLRAGIHLIHKPVGPTSFAVMRAFSQGAGGAGHKLPVCHGGTLDPFASGLLLVLAGPATKLMDFLHPLPKRYEAQVAWGVETDTGDGGGRAVTRGDASALSAPLLDEALSRFTGWTSQVPPATSAKKIDGEPAYKKAHRGEDVVLPPSKVYLHSARWMSHDLPSSSRLELLCRGGYYVRALARDLGRALGCGAHLTGLCRTTIGPWGDPLPDATRWIHGSDVLPWWPLRELTEDEFYALKEGRTIPKGVLSPPRWSVPVDFPPPELRVSGVRRGAVVALLREEGARLETALRLPGGV